MNTPNWQHHSKKERKRTLKPQALRAAKARRRQLIKRLQASPKGRFSSIIRISKENTDGSSVRNQVTTGKVACY